MVPKTENQTGTNSPSPTSTIEMKPEHRKVATCSPKLIGLAGKARSGKDTVAGFLPLTRVSFAAPLKKGLQVMLQLSDEYVNGDLKDVALDWLGKSPRQLLQTLGTDWGRDTVHKDLWTIVAAREIESYLQKGMGVVVTDVRFDNEANLIRSMGGVIWHVKRSDAQSVNSHISEAGVTFVNGDKHIRNDGSLDDLKSLTLDLYQRPGVQKQIVAYDSITGPITVGEPAQVETTLYGAVVTRNVLEYDEQTEVFETEFQVFVPA